MKHTEGVIARGASDDELLYGFASNVVAAASAGTGKTHRLTGVYLHLVLGLSDLTPAAQELGTRRVSAQSILATTFTKDAAAEMRMRIEGRLRALITLQQEQVASALDGPQGAWLRELISSGRRIGRVSTADDILALQQFLPELTVQSRLSLREIARAPITTMHSFATELLRAYPVEAAVPPQFEIMTDDDNASLLSRIVADELESRLSDSSQRQRLLSLFDKLGGRSGLVSAIDGVLKKLAEEGLRGSEILVRPNPQKMTDVLSSAVTALQNLVLLDPSLLWKGKADAKRLDQVDQARGELQEAQQISKGLLPWLEVLETANAEGESLESAVAAIGPREAELERLGKHLKAAYAPFARTSTEQAKAGIAAIRTALGCGDTSPGEAFGKLVRNVPSLALSETLGGYLREIVAQVEQAVTQERRKLGAMTFSDVMLAARDLLSNNPDIQVELGRKYRAVLVDEFQDTNRVQRDLIYYLHQREDLARQRRPGSPATEQELRRSGLLIVGDRKQSIYGFRGADVAVFQSVCANLCGQDAIERLAISPELHAGSSMTEDCLARLVTLSTNRRSKPKLLEAFNAIAKADLRFNDEHASFSHLPKPERMSFCDDERLLAPPEANDLQKEPRTHVVRGDMDSAPGLSFDLGQSIVAARLIQGLNTGKLEVLVRGKEGDDAFQPKMVERPPLSLRHLAVLVRSYTVARPLAAILDDLDIPFVYGGKGGLYTSTEAQDLSCIASLLVDPSDSIALVNALRGPWAALTDASLLAIATDSYPSSPKLPSYQRLRKRIHQNDLESPLQSIPAFERERLVQFLDNLDFAHRHLHRLGCAGAVELVVESMRMEESLAALPRADQRIANLRALIDDIRRRALDPRAFLRCVQKAESGADINPPSPQDPDDEAVRIMTIHGSKGLEFPVVILMQAKAKLNPSNRIPRIGRASGGLEVALSTGAQSSGEEIRLREMARDWAERQRLSYVALTRARDELFILGCPMEDNKGVPKESLYASLALALPSLKEKGLADELVVRPVLPPSTRQSRAFPTRTSEASQTERAEVIRALVAPEVAEAEGRGSRALLVVTPLADYATCPRRYELAHVIGIDEHPKLQKEAIVASEVAEQDADTEAPVEETFPILMDARGKGTLLHAALERFTVTHWSNAQSAERWLNDGQTDELALQLVETVGAIEPEVGEHVRGRLTKWLKSGQAREIGEKLSRGNCQVRVEEAFVVPLGEKGPYLKGTMDLVVIETAENGEVTSVKVIDYKSGRKQGDTVAGHYLIQMAAYRHAAKCLWGSQTRCEASLMFLGGKQCEEVSASAEVDLQALYESLAKSRATGEYGALERREDCKKHRCGYVGMCHPL